MENDNMESDDGIKSVKPYYRRSQTELLLQGRWTLICDCEALDFSRHTESHRIMNALRELHKKNPEIFPRSPEIYRKYKGSEFLYLYTSNLRNEEEVKSSADILRDNIDFPYTITYFLRSKHYKSPSYTHTPEKELYRHLEESWQQRLVIEADGSFVTDYSSESAKDSLEESTLKASALLPSEVTDEEYLFFPKNDSEEMQSSEFGKWMVFSMRKEEQDAVWRSLLPLCENGILSGLKATTSKSSAVQKYYGVRPLAIICFSKIFDDKIRLKETADTLRKAICYKNILYFKTNSASMAGEYRHEGAKNIAKYMHTVSGSLYERDKFYRWRLVVS